MKTDGSAFISSFVSWSRAVPSKTLQSARRGPRSRVVPVRNCSDISKAEVENIAKLAQLRFSDDELLKVVPEIKKIIDFFDIIRETDVEGVEPMTSAQNLQNVMREDVPHRFSNVDGMLAEAPCLEKDFIRVPKLSSNPSDYFLDACQWGIVLSMVGQSGAKETIGMISIYEMNMR
ncbi:unnamed protein product [Agarophyton chilense]